MTQKIIELIKAKVLKDWAARQLESTRKRSEQNARTRAYAKQERDIKNGTYTGPPPRRKKFERF